MTDHREKTALMQAIERLEDVFAGNENNTYKLSEIKGLVLMELERYKIAEKQQMRKCYAIAEGDSKFPAEVRITKGLTFNDYYTKTFNNK